MEHEGKGYCGIHDPVKQKAKQAVRDKRWREEWDARDRERKALRERERIAANSVKALERIRDGHNNPRELARDVLSGKDLE